MLWLLLVWLGQALLLGTVLSAIESVYGPFKLHAWAYLVGLFWPVIWVIEMVVDWIE